MKKLILTVVTVFSLIACKKNAENSESNFENAASKVSANISEIYADSTFIAMENLPKLSRKQTDSAIQAIKKVAVVKIAELKDEKELLTQKVAKEMDSATRTAIISEIKITQSKIDSVKNKVAVNVSKKNTAPKIIRETKVVYRDTPKKEVVERAPKIVKDGQLEILVEDLETAQRATKNQIAKYDGVIKNEVISSYQNDQYTYLQVSVPLEKSEYLIQDLENYVGTIILRKVETTGQDYAKNSICNLEITLVNETGQAYAQFDEISLTVI